MSNEAPCKGCREREIGCHDTCPRYKRFKDARQEVLNRRHRDSDQVGFFGDVAKRRKNAWLKGKKR